MTHGGVTAMTAAHTAQRLRDDEMARIVQILRSWANTQASLVEALRDNRDRLAAAGEWPEVETLLATTVNTYFDGILPLVFPATSDIDLRSLRAKIVDLARPYSQFLADESVPGPDLN